jgi:hypothetical protein
VVFAVGLVQHALLVQIREHAGRVLGPEPLLRVERDLERGALEVVHEHMQVVGIDQSGLRGAVQDVLGVLDDVLIDGRRGRDEERGRKVLTPPRAAHLLPRRRDGAGIAEEHRGLQRADVDAELERIRGYDAADGPIAEAALDRAPLGRQIATAVAADQVRWPLWLREP